MGDRSPDAGTWTWVTAVIAIETSMVGIIGVAGADLLWAVALGDHIVRTGNVPEGIPFASAPTQGWPNPFVVGEVLLSVLTRLGDGALLGALVVAVAVTLSLLAVDMRRSGASDPSSALVLIIVVAGGLAAFFIVRIQVFAPALFAALMLAIRGDRNRPTHGIWFTVPILALWANLHGSALIGLAVTCCYLVFGRLSRRPSSSILVALAAGLTLMATSAGLRYPTYVRGVLTNAAAQGGEQMWAPLSLSSPLDLAFLVALAGVALLYLLRRRPVWEYIVAAGLSAGTALAARTGFWLLLFLAAPAAGVLRTAIRGRGPMIPARGAAVVISIATAFGVFWAFTRGEQVVLDGNSSLVRPVVQQAGGHVVLAEEPLVEALAAHGVTIWVGNPLDAFAKADQTAYLDFVAGRRGGRAALDHVDVVVVQAGGSPARLVAADGRFIRSRDASGWLVYQREP